MEYRVLVGGQDGTGWKIPTPDRYRKYGYRQYQVGTEITLLGLFPVFNEEEEAMLITHPFSHCITHHFNDSRSSG